MGDLHCWMCGQQVTFSDGPCPHCDNVNPIGFRKSISGMLQAMAVMIIAVCTVV